MASGQKVQLNDLTSNCDVCLHMSEEVKVIGDEKKNLMKSMVKGEDGA